MLARELGRPSRAAAAIGWAVTALLLVDPRLVDDVGFRLSAMATVGLIAWGSALTNRIAGPRPGRLRAWLAESLGVSMAAQLATLPMVVLSFGRLSIVSPVVNLGVVPLVAPAMAAAALALGAGLLTLAGLPAAVAAIGGLPAWATLGAIVGLVRAGASLPFASVQVEPPWDVAVAAACAAVIVGVAVILRRQVALGHPADGRADPGRADPGRANDGVSGGRRPLAHEPRQSSTVGTLAPWWRSPAGRGLAGALAVAVLSASVVVIHRPDGVPRVTVIDVGQGDAILVEGGRGGRMLIDGGPDPGRLLVALDEHLPPWDRRIDLLVLSHPHEDHAAGLAALVERYGVGRVLEPGMIGPGPGYTALNAELIARGISRGVLVTGDRLSVDDIGFTVLWPDQGSVPEHPGDGGTAINNVSIVLLGETGRHRFLLAGDIEEQIDPRLLARGLPTVDFLKVAHHGSRTSSTGAFLAAVRPAVAVISAGRGNPYGHPAPATVARLEASGAEVLRTDQDGSVTVELGPGPLRVRASRSQAARGSSGASGLESRSQAGLGGAVPARAGTPGGGRTATGPAGNWLLCGLATPDRLAAGSSVAAATSRPTSEPDSPQGRPQRAPGAAAITAHVTPVATGAVFEAEQADWARHLGYDAPDDPRLRNPVLPACGPIEPHGVAVADGRRRRRRMDGRRAPIRRGDGRLARGAVRRLAGRGP
jgi:competence protein ComEC